MLVGPARSWEALAATLGALTRIVCPSTKHALSSAASSTAASYSPQRTAHRRLPRAGPGLADFIAVSALERLPDGPSLGPEDAAAPAAARHPRTAAAVAGSKAVYIETYVSLHVQTALYQLFAIG